MLSRSQGHQIQMLITSDVDDEACLRREQRLCARIHDASGSSPCRVLLETEVAALLCQRN